MKKCTYCGKRYPDDAVECGMDGKPLFSVAAPSPVLPSAKPIAAPSKRPHAGGTFVGGVIIMVLGIGLVFWMYAVTEKEHVIYLKGWLFGVFFVLFGFYTCMKAIIYAVQSKLPAKTEEPGSLPRCSYCGRERVNSVPYCSGCGTNFED